LGQIWVTGVAITNIGYDTAWSLSILVNTGIPATGQLVSPEGPSSLSATIPLATANTLILVGLAAAVAVDGIAGDWLLG